MKRAGQKLLAFSQSLHYVNDAFICSDINLLRVKNFLILIVRLDVEKTKVVVTAAP